MVKAKDRESERVRKINAQAKQRIKEKQKKHEKKINQNKRGYSNE